MASHDDDPSLDGAGLTIGDASALLGVPAPTLRSWERRYGLPDTARSPGGHRRYRAAEMTQLRLMRDEIAVGRPAADAARWVRGLLDETAPARVRVESLLASSQSMDAAAIRASLERSTAEHGLAATVDDVVLPVLRQIGAWWESGRWGAGEERHTTELVRAWLSKETVLAPPPLSSRQVLLAVGPRDLHTLGIEAMACLLAQLRVGSRVLRPPTSPEALATAVTTSTAPTAAVVLVSHLPSQRRLARASLVAAEATGVPVFFAGNAFLLPASRRGVVGTYLGESLGDAADLVRRLVES